MIAISQEQLEEALCGGLSIYECTERFMCSTVTIRKRMKKYGIKSPKGFYATGKKVGRPPGFSYSKEQCAEMSERMRGAKNPFFGERHTDAAKKKMSENHGDISGEKNPFSRSLKDPQKHEEHVQRCLSIWESRDEEYRRKFGEKLSESLAGSKKFIGSGYYTRHKHGFLETEKAGRVFYRSSWEKRVCEFLDSCNLVTSFSVEPYCVKYTNSNGDTRYTRIDFEIKTTSGLRTIFEVKPEALLKYGENHNKIAGIKSYCKLHEYQFCLIHKESLDNLGNIIEGIERKMYYVA
jgi:hypothetical protein